MASVDLALLLWENCVHIRYVNKFVYHETYNGSSFFDSTISNWASFEFNNSSQVYSMMIRCRCEFIQQIIPCIWKRPGNIDTWRRIRRNQTRHCAHTWRVWIVMSVFVRLHRWSPGSSELVNQCRMVQTRYYTLKFFRATSTCHEYCATTVIEKSPSFRYLKEVVNITVCIHLYHSPFFDLRIADV